ncbi:MAG: helix-turn-helix domain-containing protein [Nitrolancea sp.]
MESLAHKPTRSETDVAARQQMVAWAEQGWTYAAIAAALGCSLWTVGRWIRAARRGGDAALGYKSRRPHTPHPLTTSVAIQERIRAIRQAHPGWGPRLIRRQLACEESPTLPSEVTIRHWLRIQGFPTLRPAATKPLGWSTPPPEPGPIWQADFKQKGGSRI